MQKLIRLQLSPFPPLVGCVGLTGKVVDNPFTPSRITIIFSFLGFVAIDCSAAHSGPQPSCFVAPPFVELYSCPRFENRFAFYLKYTLLLSIQPRFNPQGRGLHPFRRYVLMTRGHYWTLRPFFRASVIDVNPSCILCGLWALFALQSPFALLPRALSTVDFRHEIKVSISSFLNCDLKTILWHRAVKAVMLKFWGIFKAVE